MLAFVRGIDHDNMAVMYVVIVMYALSLLCIGPFREQPCCTAPDAPISHVMLLPRMLLNNVPAVFWITFLCARTVKTVGRVDIADVDRIVEDAGHRAFIQATRSISTSAVTPMVVRAGRRSTGK